jgi:hypothetical protein
MTPSLGECRHTESNKKPAKPRQFPLAANDAARASSWARGDRALAVSILFMSRCLSFNVIPTAAHRSTANQDEDITHSKWLMLLSLAAELMEEGLGGAARRSEKQK